MSNWIDCQCNDSRCLAHPKGECDNSTFLGPYCKDCTRETLTPEILKDCGGIGDGGAGDEL
jgi:hypothetical protein